METGDYILYYFDHKGSKLKDLTETCSCGLVGAEAIAEDMIFAYKVKGTYPLPVSYAIDRRVINSTDEVKSW